MDEFDLEAFMADVPDFGSSDDSHVGSDFRSQLLSDTPSFEPNYEIAPEPESAGFWRTMGDLGLGVAKSFVHGGDSAVGIGNLATGGMLGDAMEALGYDPKRTIDFFTSLESDAKKLQDQQVHEAEGFWDMAKTIATNPRALSGMVAETSMLMAQNIFAARHFAYKAGQSAYRKAYQSSLNTSLRSNVVGNQAAQIAREAATRAQRVAELKAAIAAASITEGAQAGGLTFQELDRQGVEYGRNVAASVGTAFTTAAISALSTKLGAKVGLGDPEVPHSSDVAGSYPLKVGGSMFQEGIMEEMPQTASEQMLMNWAQGKPIMEGVPEQAAIGGVVGAAAGGGMEAVVGLSGSGSERDRELAAIEQRATDQSERLANEQSGSFTDPSGEVMPSDEAIAEAGRRYPESTRAYDFDTEQFRPVGTETVGMPIPGDLIVPEEQPQLTLEEDLARVRNKVSGMTPSEIKKYFEQAGIPASRTDETFEDMIERFVTVYEAASILKEYENQGYFAIEEAVRDGRITKEQLNRWQQAVLPKNQWFSPEATQQNINTMVSWGRRSGAFDIQIPTREERVEYERANREAITVEQMREEMGLEFLPDEFISRSVELYNRYSPVSVDQFKSFLNRFNKNVARGQIPMDKLLEDLDRKIAVNLGISTDEIQEADEAGTPPPETELPRYPTSPREFEFDPGEWKPLETDQEGAEQDPGDTVEIPVNQAEQIRTTVPRRMYHTPRSRTGDEELEDGIRAYPIRPTERELLNMFKTAGVTDDNVIYLSPVPLSEDALEIDLSRLDPSNLRPTFQAEGNVIHKGDIPEDAISRPKPRQKAQEEAQAEPGPEPQPEQEKPSERENKAETAQSAEPEAKAEPAEQPSEGDIKTIYTPGGKEIKVRYLIYEKEDLIFSNTPDGKVVADYPEELQPRDRTGRQSTDQIRDIFKNFQPERLMEAPETDAGAPVASSPEILGIEAAQEKRIVESGNGRMAVLELVFEEDGQKLQNYLTELEEGDYDIAEQYGTNNLSDLKEPVLIRERVEAMPLDEVIEYTRDSNESNKLDYTPSQQARIDADRITDVMLTKFNPDQSGNLLSAGNREFMSMFLESMSANEARGLMTDAGFASTKAAERAKAAVFSKAYDSDDLVKALTEEGDQNIQNILTALVRTTPKFIEARAEDAKLDLADQGFVDEMVTTLVGAIEMVNKARQEKRPIEQYILNNELFGESAPVKAITGILATPNISANKLTDFLNILSDEIIAEIVSRRTTDMFGERPRRTVADVTERTVQAFQERQPAAPEQRDITAPPDTEGSPESEPDAGRETGQRDEPGPAQAEEEYEAPYVEDDQYDEMSASERTAQAISEAEQAVFDQIEAVRDPAIGLANLKIPEIKDMLRAVGLKVGGKKSVLEERLLDWADEQKEFAKPDRLDEIAEGIDQSLAEAFSEFNELTKPKPGTLNTGFDPEIMRVGAKIGGLLFAKGVIKFAQWARAVLRGMRQAGANDQHLDSVKPMLKVIYDSMRNQPETTDAIFDQMDDVRVVRNFDLNSLNLEDTTDDESAATVQGGTGRTDTKQDSNRNAQDGRRNTGTEPGDSGRPAGEIGDQQPGISGLPDGRAVTGGESGNPDVHSQTGKIRPESSPGGRGDTRGSAQPGATGVSVRSEGNRGTVANAERSSELDSQKPANVKPIPGNLKNIKATLPQLFSEQQEDVEFAENRLDLDDGRGVMFTNGTGTGKTFVGLGVIKRFTLQGKNNIIITAPREKVIRDWIKSGKKLGLTITKLNDTKDAGKGIVITTYENFGDNESLANRDWDLIVHDEAHRLSSNAQGKSTKGLDASRALTGHRKGVTRYAEMKNPNLVEEIRSLKGKIDSLMASDNQQAWAMAAELEEQLTEKFQEWRAALEAARENRGMQWEQRLTKRLDLSATPFSYQLSVDHAEGFLFDYEDDGGKDEFFVRHFGYRIKNGQLTKPDSQVDNAIMERQFNTWLKENRVLSGRRLSVDQDYSREFVAIDDFVGNEIDRGMEIINDNANDLDLDHDLMNGYKEMAAKLRKMFPYHQRVRLLEAIKARYSVERAKKHIALGRKVVLFHSRIKGGSTHPFKFPQGQAGSDYEAARQDFNRNYPDLVNLDIGLERPLDLFAREFGDNMTVYNGELTNRQKNDNPDKFNKDPEVNLIVLQEDAAEGISLHDNDGGAQRVLINMGLPVKPTQAIQIEGRIYRVGQQSDAIFEYFNTGTNFERWTFASKIAERADTADNLGMGEEARGLRDAFVDAYENSNTNEPSLEQGRGGKERDASIWSAVSEFDRAKTHYFGNQKPTGRRDQREGVDYFATPEPLGYKMVQWAGLKSGESALEPSAGHGAILRYFPENVNIKAIEPSGSLASRASLRAPQGTDFKQHQFEDLDIGANKFDAVIMNPPYGNGGQTAMEHLAKAMRHLNNGGRIVAILPAGPAADKRFNELMYGNAGEVAQLEARIKQKKRNGESVAADQHRLDQLKNFHVTSDLNLPRFTFERAGTQVSTHLVVIDRIDDFVTPVRMPRMDVKSENINEFFDKIEGMVMPDRVTPPKSGKKVLEEAGLTVEEEDGFVRIGGKTFPHLDDIRAVKNALGSGTWNPTLEKWEFSTLDNADPVGMLADRIRPNEPKFSRRAPRPFPEGWTSASRHLTQEERAKVRPHIAEKILSILDTLPSAKEMAEVALAGKAKRGWYRKSAEAILDVFGLDAPRFAALLAAMSPQTSVESNLLNTLNTWVNWVSAGRPTSRKEIIRIMGQSVQGDKGVDSVLDAWVNNSVRALSSPIPENLTISGPKVNSFMLNLRGFVNEVTNDAWMAAYAAVDQRIFGGSLNASGTDPGKGTGYLAMSARTRQAARSISRITGERWTPAEVQETVWSWAKALYEYRAMAGETRTMVQIVNDNDLTDDIIADTPEFGELFHEPIFLEILRRGGYGAAVDQITRKRRAQSRQARVTRKSGSQGKAESTARAPSKTELRRAARRLDRLYDQRQQDRSEIKFSRGRLDGSAFEVEGLSSDQQNIQDSQALNDALAEYYGISALAGGYTAVEVRSSDDTWALGEISRALGKRIVYVQREPGTPKEVVEFAGVVIPGHNDKIFIDVEANDPALVILGHEFLHQLRRDAPNLYQQIANIAIPRMRAHSIADYEKGLRAMDGELNMEPGDLFEEMIADTLGHQFRNAEFWEKVAQQNPTGFRALVARLRAFLRNIMAKIQGNPTHEFYNDFEAVQNILAQTVARYAEQFITSPPFYSELEQSLAERLSNKGTGKSYKAQLRAIVKKNAALQEEYDWSGLEDWLDTQDKLTKGDVLEFVAGNEIVVEEVMKGGPEELASVGISQDDDGWSVWDDDTLIHEGIESEGAAQVLMEQYIEEELGGIDSNVRYPREQLPGGENYKELLLTLPADTWTGQTVSRDSAVFRSGHWDEPNVLAWVRFNDRTDAEGNKVLFLEEIQSDFHQDGRERGYRGVDISNLEIVQIDNLKFEIVDKSDPDNPKVVRKISGGMKAAEEELMEIQNPRGAVPDAPFKRTIKGNATTLSGWAGLSMKRMIRYAAENGYDSIGWTTGEQQGERYPGDEKRTEGMKGFYDKMLVNEVNKYVKKWGSKVGTAQIDGAGNSNSAYTFDDEHGNNYGEFPTRAAANEEIERLEQQFQTDTEFSVRPLNVESGGVHSLPVTDAMRQSVMQGQPRFSRERRLPTDQASRMARAREQGFMTDDKGNLVTVYHATNTPEEKLIAEGFNPDVVSRSEFDRVGTWFEGSPEGSEIFNYYGKRVVPAHIRMENPLIVESDKTMLGRMHPDNMPYEKWLEEKKGMDVFDSYGLPEADQLKLEKEYRDTIETAWAKTIPDLRKQIRELEKKHNPLMEFRYSDDFKKLPVERMKEVKEELYELGTELAEKKEKLTEAEIYDGLDTYIRYFEGQVGADTSKFGIDRWSKGDGDKFRSLLNRQGYDGVIIKDHFGDNNNIPRTWYIVPPSDGKANIRSIHAQFDPAKADKPGLMFMRRTANRTEQTDVDSEFEAVMRREDDIKRLKLGRQAGQTKKEIRRLQNQIDNLDPMMPGQEREAETRNKEKQIQSRKRSFVRVFNEAYQDDTDTEFDELNRRFKEEHKTLAHRVKQSLKKQFAPGGLLPNDVFKEKITRDSQFNAEEFWVRHILGEFERAAKRAYGKPFRNVNEGEMLMVSKALEGDITALESLPDYLAEKVMVMRDHIDNMSDQYIEILQEQIARMDDLDSPVAQAKLALVQKILSNKRKYAHRSYKAFDDPKWFKKIPNRVLNEARRYFIERFAELGDPNPERAAEDTLGNIVKTETAYSDIGAFIMESKLGQKDLSVLMRKKDIAPEVRALLGEYADPRVRFAKSATKMNRLIWNQRFLDKVLEIGEGVFFWKKGEKPPEATEQFTRLTDRTFDPLNGLWTTPEVHQAFVDALNKEQMEKWYETIVQMNGWVKFSKTVLSPTTAMRNWQSAMLFAMANGHFDMRHITKSISGLNEYFRQTGRRGRLDYLARLLELGVIYDNPYAGEMMKLLADTKVMDTMLDGKTALTLGTAFRWARSFYQYGDDFWKIIGFENEKQMLMNAGMEESAAEKEAAERIRNTYPTYSMVGSAIKSLRRFPLAGTFVSFPAEIIRTSANMAIYVAKDLKNPQMRPIALRRLAGMSIAAGFAYAIQEWTKSLLDIDDDEEEAIRELAAPWSKNSNFWFYGRNDKGELEYFDLSFMDPYNIWKRPITAIMRDQPWDDALKSGAVDFLSPFLGTDILANSIMEVYANKRSDTGSPVYNENDLPHNQLADIANHLRKDVQPGLASNLDRTWSALQGEVRSSGKKYDLTDEGLAWVGWRRTTLDPKVSLYYRSYEFKDAKADATRSLTRVLRDPNKVSDADIRGAYRGALELRQIAYTDMYRVIHAARKAGMTDRQITKILSASRVSKDDIKNLLRGQVPNWSLSTASMRNAVRKAESLIGRKRAQQIRQRYQQVRQGSIQ